MRATHQFLESVALAAGLLFLPPLLAAGPGTYRVTGELTLRGVTREVDLEARSSDRFTTAGGERRDFRVTGSIRRSDFGITWNDTWAGRLILDDRVDIQLDIALEPSG